MTWWSLVDQFVRDFRHGARAFVRHPGFAAVAVLTLALGTGANTAIFTVLYNAVLRPLGYPAPDRLMRLERAVTTDERGPRVVGFDSAFVDWARESRSFESLASYARQGFTLTGAADADRVIGEIVSASYFPTLGVTPAVGRVFLDEEDQTPGSNPVAVVSDAMWRSRFAGRRDAVGSVIRLNRVSLTIVGIMPASFNGESGDASVWIPRMMESTVTHGQGTLYTAVVGRLRSGVTPAQANAEVRRAVADMPDAIRLSMTGTAVPLDESRRDPRLRSMLAVLFGAVSFVVLIACVNLANLLLARGLGRQREIAVRLSLGAGRGAVVRQMLTECLILSLAGAAVGLLFAAWSVDALALLRPQDDTAVWPTYLRQVDASAFGINRPVCLFSLGLAMVTTVLFGLVPALQASRANVQQSLQLETESWSGGRRAGHMWRALIAVEVALVFVLLAAAGLMLRSFDRFLDRPIGIDARGILTFRVTLPTDAYDLAAAGSFFDRLLPRMAALPGVESVARVRHLPVRERGTVTGIQIDGGPDTHYVGYNAVDPVFFRVFRVRLVSGRPFDERDGPAAPPVVVVTESAARQWFGTLSPLGHRVKVMGTSAEIVGVVADVRYEPQRPQLPIAGDIYVSWPQRADVGAYVAMRTDGDPRRHIPALRKIIAELDPGLPLSQSKTMEEYVAGVQSYARFTTVLLALFATLALLLAVVGIYGTLSYAAASRRREIGIRMALGASRPDVLGMILREGMTVCAAGLALGLPLALMAMRAMRALLYEISPADPLALTVAILVLATTAIVACFVPARRAACASPIAALRR
jgi:putative ABC transport system permease protein